MSNLLNYSVYVIIYGYLFTLFSKGYCPSSYEEIHTLVILPFSFKKFSIIKLIQDIFNLFKRVDSKFSEFLIYYIKNDYFLKLIKILLYIDIVILILLIYWFSIPLILIPYYLILSWFE